VQQDLQNFQRRLGLRIRELRKRRGWSQEEFAHACGLDRSYMGSVERGERNVTLSSLRAIAKGLDVTLSVMFKGLD
jgi:transcriptional regulator with XRE-family HTH domain